jgi:arsenite methyltransferase
VRFQSGSAERLPVADAGFDAAVSVQVFEYGANVSRAIEEMFRALKPPRGRRRHAVVVATDWDSILWHSSDPPRMQRVLDAFAEHCAFSSLPRNLGRKLEQAGFEVQDHRLVPQFNPALDPNAHSYHLLQLACAFLAGRRGVTKREAAAWAEDLRQLGERASTFSA